MHIYTMSENVLDSVILVISNNVLCSSLTGLIGSIVTVFVAGLLLFGFLFTSVLEAKDFKSASGTP